MKNIFYILVLLSLVSCEDVIDLNLSTAKPKLVIDASIKWQKGTLGNEQKIKLSTTTGFYSNVIPKVSGATVFITNSSNDIFNFVESTTSIGEYICTDFVPAINENYTLTVVVNGETYTASEKLLPTPDIVRIEQKTVEGFSGEEFQVKYFYQDNGQENNYYLIGFKYSGVVATEFAALSDEFFQGNEMFGFYTNEDLKSGDELFMSLQGISSRYFNYMDKIISISGSAGGSPFSTPPATVKGNIINQTNSQNFPLGYFNLSEIDARTYILE